MDVIFLRNANVVQLTDLTNGMTAELIGDAEVSCTLLDTSGANVVGPTGFSWPLTMAAVTGATGSYRGLLPHTLVLATGTYTAQVLATASGMHAEWNVPLRATARTG